MNKLLVELSDLHISYKTVMGTAKVIEGLNLEVQRGERIALVGESASGKSTLGHVIAGMFPPNAKITGSVKLEDQNILKYSENELTRFRGSTVFMIFQNPLNSLDPVKNIGRQLAESVILRNAKNSIQSTEKDVQNEIRNVLLDLRLPDPDAILKRYPHELSGGQVQRIVIAMALILKPKLLIADEPTTALDVTIQAQFIELLKKLNNDLGMSIMFITHDIALANSVSDRIVVLYSGRVIEIGKTQEVIREPLHPYTTGLIESIPKDTKSTKKLHSIPGSPPAYMRLPTGCRFHPRCSKVMEKCRQEEPEILEVRGRNVRCWLYE